MDEHFEVYQMIPHRAQEPVCGVHLANRAILLALLDALKHLGGALYIRDFPTDAFPSISPFGIIAGA